MRSWHPRPPLLPPPMHTMCAVWMSWPTHATRMHIHARLSSVVLYPGAHHMLSCMSGAILCLLAHTHMLSCMSGVVLCLLVRTHTCCREKFRVIVVMPVHPEGDPDSDNAIQVMSVRDLLCFP